MKTIRTILATFGVTSAAYGLFALIAMRLNPAFTGRSIYQLFRDTGFVALVIGIGCVLSFVIMTIAIVSFRDDGAKKKREITEDDLFDDFIEEETVPEEFADEADESWSPEIKRKQRKALRHAEEEPSQDLFTDDDEPAEELIPFREDARADEDAAFRPSKPRIHQTTEPEEPPVQEIPQEAEAVDAPEEAPQAIGTKRCIYCGEIIDADSAFCMHCGKRV